MRDLSRVLIDKLEEMLADVADVKNGKILFIGLGNRDVTPDAVGPLTMDRLQYVVPEYYSEDGSEVFVYAPGVTIQTGLKLRISSKLLQRK